MDTFTGNLKDKPGLREELPHSHWKSKIGSIRSMLPSIVEAENPKH